MRIVPCHLGLAGHGLDGVADDEADADARADGRGAVDDAGTDGLQTGLELTGLLGGEEDCGHDVSLLVECGCLSDRRSGLVLGVQRVAEVDGGEQREDVRLQEADEDLERR